VGAVLRAQGAVAPKSIAVVVMDVTTFHGHDMLLDGVRLVEELRDCLAPGLATVIVKSRVMTRHASQVWSSQKFLHLRQTEGAWRECGPQCKVLAGVGVLPYRNTIKQVVADGCKRILEIGCADGASTRLLCTALQGAGVSLSPDAAVCGPDEGWVVGLDTGKRCVANAQRQGPPVIQYALVDGWDTAALMQAAKGVDAIYIDVGGISGTDGLFEALALLRLLEAAFRPTLRYLVFKSRCLADHAGAYSHADLVLR